MRQPCRSGGGHADGRADGIPEGKAELIAFYRCDAGYSAQRLTSVKAGVWPLEDNPLVNAPHIHRANWSPSGAHPYSREVLPRFPQAWQTNTGRR